ncbi:MAG: HIT family protein [Spirochaetota bacterium]
MRRYLFNVEKYKYVKGVKPEVECILCEIVRKNPDITSLELARNATCGVTVNLYPYNPGHLMVFPLRHLESPVQMTDEEGADIHRLVRASIRIIDSTYSPSGYNLGYNVGNHSGASISHIHMHIVPRYQNEVGFIDVLAGDRLSITDPNDTVRDLKERFAEFL